MFISEFAVELAVPRAAGRGFRSDPASFSECQTFQTAHSFNFFPFRGRWPFKLLHRRTRGSEFDREQFFNNPFILRDYTDLLIAQGVIVRPQGTDNRLHVSYLRARVVDEASGVILWQKWLTEGFELRNERLLDGLMKRRPEIHPLASQRELLWFLAFNQVAFAFPRRRRLQRFTNRLSGRRFQRRLILFSRLVGLKMTRVEWGSRIPRNIGNVAKYIHCNKFKPAIYTSTIVI